MRRRIKMTDDKGKTPFDWDGQLAIGGHQKLLDDWFVRARVLGESMVCAGKEEKITDGKEAGEGPYVVTEAEDFYKTVNTPLGDKFELGTEELSRALNLAHTAGRKAERERCAKIAESEPVNQDEWGNIVFGLGEKIAEKIRGGQDAK